MPEQPPALPADETATAVLAERGLRYALVDTADEAVTRDWVRAEMRGFLGAAPTEERLAGAVARTRTERVTGVYDDRLADPALPVATATCWAAPMTVPGGEVRSWNISGITVSPTHRRRGIARAMLEAELRTAAAIGCPLAILTVSEATIYGRYGFGPATWTADLEIDVRRAGWRGGTAPGRLQYVSRETALATCRDVIDRLRRATIGDVEVAPTNFERLFGSPADKDEQAKARVVRYDDEAGEPQGFAVHAVAENHDDYADSTVDVWFLGALTPDADRALWGFLLQHDLIGTVKAPLRSVDEPLHHLVVDSRMVRTKDVREHLWVRVVDPVAAFEARTLAGSGRLALRIDDPLGHADGDLLLTADEGGRVRATREAAPEGVPALILPIDALGSLYLGGASAETLRRAGRLAERAPGDAVLADRLLRSPVAPYLRTWF